MYFIYVSNRSKDEVKFSLFPNSCFQLLFGLRYAFFSWSYLAMAHSMSVAYHRVNPVDHMIAGFTVGSLHRLSSGWRPALAAGIMGSGSGLLIGFTFWVAHLLRGMKH